MRLSEAIILGDTQRRRDPLAWLARGDDGRVCGCAIGGALLAAGSSAKVVTASGCGLVREIRRHWPWLLTPEHCGLIGRISQDFCRVCAGSMTIEQLADSVRQVEDKYEGEPAPKPSVLTSFERFRNRVMGALFSPCPTAASQEAEEREEIAA